MLSDRLGIVLEHLGITAYRMSKDLGIAQSSISQFLLGKTTPSFDFLEKLQKKYPTINTNWLIGEQGPMLNDPTIKPRLGRTQYPDILASKNEIIALQAENIRLKDEKIAQLTAELMTFKKASDYVKRVSEKKAIKTKAK
jgi:transcriptional regulator with XRE-family HTH domain